MSIRLKCLKCAGEFKGKATLAGKRVKCPQCGATIQVPAEASLPPAASPAADPAPPVQAASIVSPRKVEAPARLPPLPPVEDPEPAWTPPRWTDDDGDVPASAPPPPAGVSVFGEPEHANTGRRVVAYILDALPTMVLMPIAMIPFIGQVFMGVLLLLYWILRDIRGASLGKWALGMEVRDVGGGTSSGGARVFRNLPFGLYGFILVLVGMASLLALIIPPLGVIAGLFGTVAVIGLNFAVIFVEFAMLLITGRRIGDRLAQTIVVRLPPIN